jgi:hypothetical protein
MTKYEEAVEALNLLCDMAEEGGMESCEVDKLKALVRSFMREGE